jgi:hypothetical protein
VKSEELIASRQLSFSEAIEFAACDEQENIFTVHQCAPAM